jgi:hypothetical protein
MGNCRQGLSLAGREIEAEDRQEVDLTGITAADPVHLARLHLIRSLWDDVAIFNERRDLAPTLVRADLSGAQLGGANLKAAVVLATRTVRRVFATSSRSTVGVMEPSEHGYVDDAAVRVGRRVAASRDLLAQALVGALPVEVPDVLGEHVLELALAQDEDGVGALAADAAEEALADGVRLRCPDGGANHPGADSRISAMVSTASVVLALRAAFDFRVHQR